MRALVWLFQLPAGLAAVSVEFFVASKCPDASRCENAFLPELLRRVGGIVDFDVSFLGEVNASAPFGVNCLHGDSECEGNALQLCVQRHFPVFHEVDALGKHSWLAFLFCVGHFNHTSESQIPQNTDACLSSLGLPVDVIDRVHQCADGEEGRRMLSASVMRTAAVCGPHIRAPRRGCKSCSMFLEGRPACVEDGGEWYNCSVGHDVGSWVGAICSAYAGQDKPLACETMAPPRVVGHSYASVDPAASAAFAVKYFGAELLLVASLESKVRLPRFDDYRGGGMVLRFARRPTPSAGGYGVAEFVRSMEALAGNLSDNSGYQWNQFFDNHLGFFVRGQAALAERLLRDGIPFWTTLDSGYYQSVYVAVPGTGCVVEVLGNFFTNPLLPRSHIRIASTQQFCTPYDGRSIALRGTAKAGGSGFRHVHARRLRVTDAGTADMNKTTWAAPDPEAVVRFAVQFLGASPIQQKRGPPADGQCATLRWARWPDGHEWHVVYTFSTDWVTKDHLAPAVPFNVSGFAAYVERNRDLKAGRYDEYLDYRDILVAEDLAPIERRLQAAGVPYLEEAAGAGSHRAIVIGLPGGLAVEVQEEGGVASVARTRQVALGI